MNLENAIIKYGFYITYLYIIQNKFNSPASFACTACGLMIQHVQSCRVAVFFGPLVLPFRWSISGKKYCNSYKYKA